MLVILLVLLNATYSSLNVKIYQKKFFYDLDLIDNKLLYPIIKNQSGQSHMVDTRGVLNFELGTDVRPEVLTTTL